MIVWSFTQLSAIFREHKTMWNWWQWIRRRNFENDQKVECDVDTILESRPNKKQARDTILKSRPNKKQPTEKFLTTYSVGLKPTKQQRVVLNEMLKVSNYTYNWCLWLVNEMGLPAKQLVLQKIVTKTKADDIDQQYRRPNDEWFFRNKMSSIKLTSCKNFCTSYKSAKTLKAKQMRPMNVEDNIQNGSIGIQKQYVRHLVEKDHAAVVDFPSQKYLCIMPDNFANRNTPNQRFIKISKSVHKIPPIDHDVKIVKRANGKFVLNIPCDPKYTRRDSSNDDQQKRICGIDPGGRTFATVYDPVDCSAFQVGLEEDKMYDIRKLHNKIDEAQKHLTYAQEHNNSTAQKQRIRQLKKLHLKVKTFVDDIHLKLSSHLVKDYSYVALGKIGVANIVKKDRPNHLSRRANRDLLCWRHYQFRQRLTNRVTMTDCQLVIQNEAYTSKKCGRCGQLNRSLGASETFICKSCDFETHRDINGARNILLKSLGMFPFS